MFTSIAFFTGIDAVRGFAGADYEQAVVLGRPPALQPVGRPRFSSRGRGRRALIRSAELADPAEDVIVDLGWVL